MIPNIYSGDYKLLAIVPLALILASLAVVLFISPVEKGIDFRGGILADLQFSGGQEPNIASGGEIEAELAARGFGDARVRQFENPLGKVVEIELGRDANLSRAEELKAEFFSKIEDVSRLEGDLLATNGSAVREEYEVARAQVEGSASEIFGIALLERDVPGMGVNELKREVTDAYSLINERYKGRLTAAFSELVGEYESISFQEISATLSARFLDKALEIVAYSTVLTVIVIFIIFRSAIPSIAVLSGAAADIIIALGAMGLFGIPLTLPSFAALLMLVGFSLDTDVLLTMRVLKHREGTARQRAFESMKTGLTMSVAALVAFGSLFVLASLTHINTYYEISSVAIAGLIGDMFATWGINGVLVLHYAERRESGGGAGGKKPALASIFRS